MEKFFTVGETAKIVKMTAETLRHYDRIGLIRPCKVDEWTNYRYYSSQEIVRLNTIQALRCMELSLEKIKEILELNDFQEIVDMFKLAEKTADERILEITNAKKKIASARAFYENKLTTTTIIEASFIKEFPKRVILLSKELNYPSLDNLWDYHRHFYKQICPEIKEKFTFEDVAGIYNDEQNSSLFAVCNKYIDVECIKTLPHGNYLCANCTEENRSKALDDLLTEAKTKYHFNPKFTVQIVVLTGILQWNYQIQIYIGKNE